jgi:hypothetical protein
MTTTLIVNSTVPYWGEKFQAMQPSPYVTFAKLMLFASHCKRLDNCDYELELCTGMTSFEKDLVLKLVDIYAKQYGTRQSWLILIDDVLGRSDVARTPIQEYTDNIPWWILFGAHGWIGVQGPQQVYKALCMLSTTKRLLELTNARLLQRKTCLMKKLLSMKFINVNTPSDHINVKVNILDVASTICNGGEDFIEYIYLYVSPLAVVAFAAEHYALCIECTDEYDIPVALFAHKTTDCAHIGTCLRRLVLFFYDMYQADESVNDFVANSVNSE